MVLTTNSQAVMLALISGLWLGGLIAIDLVEAPTKFTIRSIERTAAVELGRAVFRRFGYLEMAFSLALVGVRVGSPTVGSLRLLIICLLAVTTLIASPWLRARLGKLGATGPSEALRPYHRAYVALDGAKMLLLVLLAGLSL